MVRCKLLLVSVAALLGACGPAQKPTPAGAAAMKTKSNVDRSRCDEKDKRVVTGDVDRDGKPDVWKLYRGSEMTCKQVDFNHDGRVDYVAHFDAGGVPVIEEFDLDFDGKFDEVIFYQNGQVARKEFDTNHDGVPDIWKFFKDGRLVRMERDTKCAGKVDYWEEYTGGKLTSIRWADPNAKSGLAVDDNPEEADEAEAAVESKKDSRDAEKDIAKADADKAKADADKAKAAADKEAAEKAAAEKAELEKAQKSKAAKKKGKKK
ncbi:MAG: hypothetical protein HY906_11265 [Deltaproteobacteria bacterium]|nr:hypothetical protein [Deltaproteobacteria bacterium]